ARRAAAGGGLGPGGRPLRPATRKGGHGDTPNYPPADGTGQRTSAGGPPGSAPAAVPRGARRCGEGRSAETWICAGTRKKNGSIELGTSVLPSSLSSLPPAVRRRNFTPAGKFASRGALAVAKIP